MRLLKIFEDQYKAMKLIRIRLKSDPANQLKSYEGYVLHENDDDTMDIKNEALQDYVDSNASSFLKGVQSVGGAMSKLQSGAEAAKRFTGQGDWSVLSNLGNKFLARALDRQTEKISLFGKKGYTNVRIIDDSVKQLLLSENNISKTDVIFEDAASQFLDVIKNDVQKYKKKKRGMKNVTPRTIQKLPNTVPNSTGEVIDLDQQQPTDSTNDNKTLNTSKKPGGGNKPPQKGPNQPRGDNQFEQGASLELNFTITNQKFYGAKGTGYTLQPADEATKQILKNKNLEYALFVKRQDSDLDVVNNGALYFYQANNVLDPKYTQQSLNFTYDATIKSYVMGGAITQKIAFNVDNENIMIIDDQDFVIMGQQGNTIRFKPIDIKVFNSETMKVLRDDKPKSARLIIGRDGKPSRLNRRNQYLVDKRTIKQL